MASIIYIVFTVAGTDMMVIIKSNGTNNTAINSHAIKSAKEKKRKEARSRTNKSDNTHLAKCVH